MKLSTSIRRASAYAVAFARGVRPWRTEKHPWNLIRFVPA